MRHSSESLTDRISQVVAHYLPRRVVYWCAIRLGVHATVGPYSTQETPALTLADALKRWRKR